MAKKAKNTRKEKPMERFIVMIYDLSQDNGVGAGPYNTFEEADVAAMWALNQALARDEFANATMTVVPWHLMDNRGNASILYVEEEPVRAVVIYFEGVGVYSTASMKEIGRRARFNMECMPVEPGVH